MHPETFSPTEGNATAANREAVKSNRDMRWLVRRVGYPEFPFLISSNPPREGALIISSGEQRRQPRDVSDFATTVNVNYHAGP